MTAALTVEVFKYRGRLFINYVRFGAELHCTAADSVTASEVNNPSEDVLTFW